MREEPWGNRILSHIGAEDYGRKKSDRLERRLRDGTVYVRTYPSTDEFPTILGLLLIRSVDPGNTP